MKYSFTRLPARALIPLVLLSWTAVPVAADPPQTIDEFTLASLEDTDAAGNFAAASFHLAPLEPLSIALGVPAEEEEKEAPAEVEEKGAGGQPYQSPFSLRSAIGFTLDPETFLFALEGDYYIQDQFSLGALVQLGFEDNRTIVAPTVHFQYNFDLSNLEGGGIEKLKPFVQAGVGFAYIHRDRRRGDDDDVGFLFNFGFGLEYFLTKNVALGNNVLFNILPDDVNGENFFFSWQFVTVRFRW